MVLDTARLRYNENTTWLGMRGRDAARKSTLPRGTFYRYSRSISQRSSLWWITTRNRMVRTKVQKEWDELAKEDHTYKLTPEERRRYKGQMVSYSEQAGKNGPMKLRSNYRAAVMMKNRLHHESGEPIEEPIHPGQQRRIQQGQEVFSEDFLSSARVDQRTGWQYWPSSKFLVVVCIRMELEVSSQFFFARISFLLQLVSFTVDSDPLQPTVCVNRTPSHRVFSRTFAHLSSLFTCTAWLKVLQRVSHKNMFIHTSSRVWSFVVSPPIDLFLSFECLYLLSILFISLIQPILLHVVGTAEY